MPKEKEEDEEDMGELISLTEAAEMRGVSLQAIQDLISRGRLEPVTVAGRRLLRRGDVKDYKPAKGGRPRKGQ